MIWMYSICIPRGLNGVEMERITHVHQSHRRWYEAHPNQALLMAGDLQLNGVPPAEAAALVATQSSAQLLATSTAASRSFAARLAGSAFPPP